MSSITDFAVVVLVLVGIFFLGYSAIRHQGILDTVREIKAILQDKTEDLINKEPLKYAWGRINTRRSRAITGSC